jgi:hypothetical protein
VRVSFAGRALVVTRRLRVVGLALTSDQQGFELRARLEEEREQQREHRQADEDPCDEDPGAREDFGDARDEALRLALLLELLGGVRMRSRMRSRI